MENNSKVSRRNFIGMATAANMMLSRAYRGKWNFLDF